jgi:tetratricopeptide (TPR) repeat protein
MAQKTNNFERFWKELKRRKVIHVITVYAAIAFVILQLVDMVAEPLRLPISTKALVIVLLCIGFIIAVFVSWVYEITPTGFRKTKPVISAKHSDQIATRASTGWKIATYVSLIIIAILIAYPKIFKQDTLEKLRSTGGRISVAVMPFQNMAMDTSLNYYSDIIQDNLINFLSDYSEDLIVRQTESINSLIQDEGSTSYASISPSLVSTVSKKLDATVSICGSLKRFGSILRINAQLIDSKTEEIIKSFQVEGAAKEENIFQIIDSLSVIIKDFLIISKLIKEENPDVKKWEVTTKNPEALKCIINGNHEYFAKKDLPAAINMYLQAIAIDSNYILPALLISNAYYNQSLWEQGKKWCQKVYERRDQLPIFVRTYANILNAYYNETPYEIIKYQRRLLEIDDQLPDSYADIGYFYTLLHQYDKAIPEYKKTFEIYEKWDTKPQWIYYYLHLGNAYHNTGQYRKEKQLYKKAEKDFPDDDLLINRQAILSLTLGDTVVANRYIRNYISLHKERSSSEATMANNLAIMYEEAGIPDKAEAYYREAYSLDTNNPTRMNSLAYFLIDKDRNINEGLEVINKALELSPDDYSFIETKGWGFFKQGKYQEALDLLQKSWDLRRKDAIYNYDAYLHLEAAKKAVASQKDN